MPTGRFVDSLPCGLQIIGPYGEDLTPIASRSKQRKRGRFHAAAGFAVSTGQNIRRRRTSIEISSAEVNVARMSGATICGASNGRTPGMARGK